MDTEFLELLEKTSDNSEYDDVYIYIGAIKFAYMGSGLWIVTNTYGRESVMARDVTKENLHKYIQ